MTATVKVQISFEALVEAFASLDLKDKYKLREILDDQLFELEELENDSEVLAEVERARKEYEAGDHQILDESLLECRQRA